MNNSAIELVKAKQLIESVSNVKTDDISPSRITIRHYDNHGESIEYRVNELNKAAQLRTTVFHSNKECPDNTELSGFIEYLRLNDVRMLNMIFYLAGINSDKHHLSLEGFSKKDKQSIISAINKVKVLAALLPKHIAMPI
ncbi:DUF5347 family protein [Providencia alcalifaciens]|nr:DUF5347 family protein [Providencia alcalifaciens]EUC93749.1 hypothetical protein HMPREF1567_0616 [Providencia alcalifaciens PAL-2]CAG9412362.1 hypothetical protein NVI2019_KOLGMIGM_00847 [Providencia alcalifaciens]CAG9413334.1 hypothetical protein NVI2019_OGMBKCAO_00846 [Providencia alcalifaciens]CAG9413479.1 hypothetical protein NVI2019_ANGEOOBF_00846 [Providencia alcalifaciens]CAG9428627.1 hypothetical protein NVI2019_PLFLNFOB_02970 [Providencia alcalifaciens]